MAPNSERLLEGKRILVVDDEWLIATEIAGILEDAGGVVFGPTKNFEEASVCIKSEKLDAALLDANLNGNSSEPIAEFLSQRNIPFAVVSGYGKLELDGPLLQAAMRIDKPFSDKSILAVLKNIFADGSND